MRMCDCIQEKNHSRHQFECWLFEGATTVAPSHISERIDASLMKHS